MGWEFEEALAAADHVAYTEFRVAISAVALSVAFTTWGFELARCHGGSWGEREITFAN